MALFPLFVSGSTWTQFGIAGTNYVGPGYSAGEFGGSATDSSIAPTNKVDEVAFHHDVAYEAAGKSLTPKQDILKADIQFLKDVGNLLASNLDEGGELLSAEEAILAQFAFTAITTSVFVRSIPDAFKEAIDIIGSPLELVP